MTDEDKLAIMESDVLWEPAVPLLPGVSFSQGDQQHLLWGYPSVLWAGAAAAQIGFARTGNSGLSTQWSDPAVGFWGGWW